MVFTEKELEGIDVDTSDEWMFPDMNRTKASVMLSVYEPIQKKACDFFGIDFDAVIENGWVDIYADIDVMERVVTSIYWVIVPNDDEVSKERSLEVNVNRYEGAAICRQLEKTSGVTEFINEAKAFVERGWEDV